jgi:3-deoxy-manno-octulosonate cytidylyltransferase (CMP-KDO synthetase)
VTERLLKVTEIFSPFSEVPQTGTACSRCSTMLSSKTAGSLISASAGIATLATPITDASELFNDNAVKVVVDNQGFASYFSRAPIPWVRGVFRPGERAPAMPEGIEFLRHIGMYAYRAGVLRQLAAHEQVACERAESLEQLRALAMGIGIHVTRIAEPPAPGVDTEEDLERAIEEFAQG